MAAPTSAGERHHELWQQREKRLSQLLFATLLFGVLGHWKVVGPSAANAREHRQNEARTAALASKLEQENARLAALSPVQDALAQVGEAVDREPWRDVVERLKRDFEALRAARDLADHDLVRARAVLRDPRLSEFPWNRTEHPQAPTMQVAPNAPAEPTSFGIVEGVAEPTTRALASLGIDPREAAAASDTDLRNLFDDAMGRRVKRLVEEKVDAIARAVDEGVTAPLATAVSVASAGSVDLGDLRTALEEQARRMTEWSREHLTDPSWYRTVDAKGEAVNDLTAMLRSWKEGFATSIERKRLTLEAARKSVDDEIARLRDAELALAARQEQLREQVKELLPEWVSGFVTPAELARTYPIVMTALAVLIVALAALVRHHFIRSRDETYGAGAAQKDAALSSCWTLVDRGPSGTLWTLAAWVAIGAAWIWFTRRGLVQAEVLWSDPFLGEPIGDAGWLEPARWAVRLAPFVLALGAILVLRDVKRSRAGAAVVERGAR